MIFLCGFSLNDSSSEVTQIRVFLLGLFVCF